jgi:4-amino-4-deoxy-L-arabinose transferase-like glycosyltransferase
MTSILRGIMANSDKIKPDKSTFWCWVVLLLIVICAAVIRGRLASMPLERDEGEYAYIAQQMLKGVLPYVSAYSMKLPGIYAVYAAFLALFGHTQTAIHVGLIIFNAATILVIFLLTRRIFGSLAGVAAAAAYAIMS